MEMDLWYDVILGEMSERGDAARVLREIEAVREREEPPEDETA